MEKILALRVPGEPDTHRAGELVRSALGEERGWGALEVEVFPGAGETLLLIHPAQGIYIDRRALRLLWERRG